MTAMATRPAMQVSAASRTQPTQHGGDLMAARPRLRPDVVFGSVQHRGPVRVHPLRVGETGKTLEVGSKERFVMVRLDGSRTLAEISAAYGSSSTRC